jgi:hypothetical protein
MKRVPQVQMRWAFLALLFAIPAAMHAAAQTDGASRPDAETKAMDMTTQSYVGMWVTADGHVRHELLPNGRYDEARGNRKSAYQGRYKITGDHIDYIDDTGFTADGDFVDGVLYHGGMILRREK